jgi:transposase-like protein
MDPVEVMISTQRRCRWAAEEKRAMVEEAEQPGMSISAVGGSMGCTPNSCLHGEG